MPGPYSIDASPVPVGWEEEPVMEGSLREESTKMNAPLTANSIFCCGLSAKSFPVCIMPHSTKGAESKYQKMHHSRGKNPSIICMKRL